MAVKKVRSCDRFRGGLCSVFRDRAVYCPPERAENCPPGACCHHPLQELKRAGIKLRRYGKKLLDPAFVDKLHAAYRKKKGQAK